MHWQQAGPELVGRQHTVAQRLRRHDDHHRIIAQEAPERLIRYQGLVLLESNDVNRQRGSVKVATDDALKPLPVGESVRHTSEETLESDGKHVTLLGIRRDHHQGHAALDNQTCQEVGLRTIGDPAHRVPGPGYSSGPGLVIGEELYHLFDSTSDLEDREIHSHDHPANDYPEEHHE